MTDKDRVLTELFEVGVVAVIRAEDPSGLVEVGGALHSGGVNFVEITMTVPGALKIIEASSAKLKNRGVHVGVGTVMDVETARAAIRAGATYVVSPVLALDVVEWCRREGVAVMPGAMTPTEAFSAWQAGADVVKIFPAGVGGPGFFKDMKGPLPHIKLMPTGGVDLQTAPQFIKAGACAVGVGGGLVSKKFIADRDFDSIALKARKYVEAVAAAR